MLPIASGGRRHGFNTMVVFCVGIFVAASIVLVVNILGLLIFCKIKNIFYSMQLCSFLIFLSSTTLIYSFVMSF